MEAELLQPCVNQEAFHRRAYVCVGVQAQEQALPPRLTMDRLKQWLRGGLTWQQRKMYWGELAGWNQVSLTDTTKLEQSVKRSVERSQRRWEVSCKQVDMNPNFLVDFERKHVGDREPHWEDHCLTREGITSAMRVLELLQHTAHTSHFPMVVDIIPILLLVLTEQQVFNAVSEMMAQHEMYLAISRRQHKVHIEAFRLLLRRLFPQTARDMERIGADTDFYLDAFFERFFVSLLPLECVGRIIDEYLIEGLETVIRYGLGLVMMFKRQLKKAKHDCAESWWNDFRNKVQCSRFDFHQFQTKAHSKVRFFKLDRESLAQVLMQAAGLVAQSEKLDLRMITDSKLSALAATSDSDDTKVEAAVLDPMALSTVDNDNDDIPPAITVPFAQVLLNHSSLIKNMKEASRLLGWCPETVRIKRPYLLFCSLEDGLSMRTMLSKIKGHSPILVLVRTADSGVVVGAYSPSQIKPGGGVVGDGSSFVFRVTHPHAGYPWVLNARSSVGSELAVMRSRSNTFNGGIELPPSYHSESASSLINAPTYYDSASATALHNRDVIDVRRLATSVALHSRDQELSMRSMSFTSRSPDAIDIARTDTSTTLHQFVLGTSTYLAFGASQSQGMNALRLTHDLSCGSSGPSDTFGNPSLVPEENGTFDVDAVEVIGFRNI